MANILALINTTLVFLYGFFLSISFAGGCETKRSTYYRDFMRCNMGCAGALLEVIRLYLHMAALSAYFSYSAYTHIGFCLKNLLE